MTCDFCGTQAPEGETLTWTIAVENGYLSSADAAAMVAAGMLSVVILPAVSIALLGRVREVRPIEPGAGL